VEDLKCDDRGVKAVLGGGEKIQVDKVLLAVGRRPNTEQIGLETVGLATDDGFVRVDEKMQTAVKDYYCIGDANGRCLLAHAASAQGLVAVENALGRERDFTAAVPSCVYTFPEIAAVGMTLQQARRRGLPVRVGLFPMTHLGKARAVGETEGFVKVLRHRETGELLGVHMMGHNVTEVVAAAGVLLHQKVSVEEVAEVVFAHPTISEALKESAEDAMGAALHLPPSKVVRIAAG